MRKTTAAAMLAAVAAALAYRPSRETIGDVLITVGGHLAYGPPPDRTPDDVARGQARLMRIIEAERAAGRNGKTGQPI